MKLNRPALSIRISTIFARHRGLSLADIALGHGLLRDGERLGIGQRLRSA